MSDPTTAPVLNSTKLDAIAQRLAITRKAFNISQIELCALAQVAPNTYNQWERGKGRPQLDQAFLLCDALGITLDWIYRGIMNGLSFEVASKIKPHLPKNRSEASGNP